ncbi:MAG: hypothetical protein K8T25_08025 [Planctomycetia bacterium]|nr:hypothetical protein [Planctomycetia bacterium]
MTDTLPAYIEERIRRPVPADSFIVPGSTPVISFGNVRTATVATLGLNPSRNEFYDKGRELVENSRRLATHNSLGTSDLSNAQHSTIVQVLEDCNTYFRRNPYRRWFDRFDLLLTACGKSFKHGSACHLDLVQWATDPTWGKLPSAIRNRLLNDDSTFLADQLKNENLQLLLVNGRGVMRQLQRTIIDDLQQVDTIDIGHVSTGLFTGRFERIRVIGWTTNLQSSFGVRNELRAELAKRVAVLAS